MAGRIVIVPTSYGPPWREGVANLGRALVAALAAAGDDVRVLAAAGTDGAGEFGERVTVLSRGGLDIRSRLSFWSRVAATLRRARSGGNERDGGFGGALTFASLADTSPLRLRALSVAAGGRLFTYVTGLATERPRPALQRLAPEPVAVISPFLLRWLPDAAVVGPFLPVSFDRRPAAPTPPRSDVPFRFLFLGAYEPGRGVEDLLAAFAETRRQAGRRVTLTMAINAAAGRTDEELSAWAAARELHADVRFAGVVDTPAEYESAHALVIPRVSERRMAFPVRILEAAYCRRPVVTTSACGMDRIVGLADAPRPGDTAGLARVMTRMARDPARYRAMVETTEATYKRFDPERSLATLIDMWKEV